MNIFILDDRGPVVKLLKNMLLQSKDIQNVLLYSSALDFLSDLKSAPSPDILIGGDLASPGISELAFIELSKVLCRNPMVKIIILTALPTVLHITKCTQAGASGFLSKETPIMEWGHAISEVSQGHQYIGLHVKQNLIQNLVQADETGLPYTEGTGGLVDDLSSQAKINHLSARQLQILRKVCSGQTKKEIADDLHLSVHTIQHHYRSVLVKLNFKRTSELIAYAMKCGLEIPVKKEQPAEALSSAAVMNQLSAREIKILKMICSGKSRKDIAAELNLSIHTVQYHYRNVLQKLNFKRTSKLIAFFIKSGMDVIPL